MKHARLVLRMNIVLIVEQTQKVVQNAVVIILHGKIPVDVQINSVKYVKLATDHNVLNVKISMELLTESVKDAGVNV